MLGMQVAIGALNDLVDAERDRVVKPAKPIPAGLASARDARWLAMIGGGLMVVLAAVSGPETLAAAGLGLGLGVLYDVRLSRTPLSWLPLALALPLVPIIGWLGTAGEVPAGLLLLVAVAVPAGLVLALANGLVDVDRDRATGKGGIVVALGARRAWMLNAVVAAGVAGLASLLLPRVPPGGFETGPAIGDWAVRSTLQPVGLVAGVGFLLLGVPLLRSAVAGIRERGWELQALGVLAVGVAWMAGLAPPA